MLLMRVGVSISCCSCWIPVPNLRVHPLGSPKGTVSSTGSICSSRPTLGSKSSLDKAMSESGGRSMFFIWMMGGCGHRLAM